MAFTPGPGLPRLFRVAALGLALAPPPAAAQLRPLEPMDWDAFQPATVLRAWLGGDVLFDQRASIGGVEGRVIEAPAAILSWTSYGGSTGPAAARTLVGRVPRAEQVGHVVVRAIIHPLRVMRVARSYAAPLPGTTDIHAGSLTDAGANALETVVRLTPERSAARWLGVLRTGIRLPTHNDREGVDRHKTDFYALLGGRLAAGGWLLSAEGGLGVFGTRTPGSDLALPAVYTAGVRWRSGVWEPSLELTGQATGRQLRGNEDLSELRLGLRLGRYRWLEARYIHGLARFSPGSGLEVYAGLALPGR